MISRAGILVLATVFASTGCTMSASSRRATILGGAAATVGGILVMRSGVVDSDGNGVNDNVLNDDFGRYMSGGLLFLAGVVAVLGGLASSEPTEPSTTTTYAPPPAPSASVSGPPGQLDDAAPFALPADLVIRSRMENQLAIQASAAARRGHCVAALATGRRLAEIDAELHRRLVAGDAAYASCLVTLR